MENKENTRFKNFKSRIPVPVEKLPRIPNQMSQVSNLARPPLKTIDNSEANITERQTEHLTLLAQKTKNQKNKKVALKSCTKQTTVYSKIKKDWIQKVYKDKDGIPKYSKIKKECKSNEVGVKIHNKEKSESKPLNVGAIIDSSTNIEVIEEIKNGGTNNYLGVSDNNLDVAFILNEDDKENTGTIWRFELERNTTLQVTKSDRSIVTPASLLEHKGVKNVKKTLKRPHSRELQGLSPVKSANDVDTKVKRRLMFERLENKMLSSDIWVESYTKSLVRDYTGDIFQHLLNVETKPPGVPSQSNAIRTCFINWIIKMNGPSGNPSVIQAACWYLDTYLSLTEVPLAQTQLVAAACFWISQKLHGPMYTASKIVRCGNNVFTVYDLRDMEKKVLNELRFPSQPVVPQEFITYLSWWCGDKDEKEIEMSATFLCLAGLMVDKSLHEEYPSVIAATSMRCALLLFKKIHLLDRLAECPVYQKIMLKSKLPISTIIHDAVITMSNPLYKYNILLEYYGAEPHRMAPKIVEAVLNMFGCSSSRQ